MKFSIITCTYNSEAYLERNIKSVLAQDCHDYEHVFIDGFSTDRTLEIIADYQKQYPDRVKLFQGPPKGISNAMNEGIKHSQGDYLIHLHSDDSFFDAAVLTDVKNFLAGQDYDWIYGRINVIELTGKSVGEWPRKKIFCYNSKSWFGRYLLKFFNYIPHQGVFIKKSVFDRFGYFDETLPVAMDPDLWLRIKDGTKWTYFGRTISNFCVRAEARSSGLKHRQQNIAYYRIMRQRYLNKFELIISDLFNWLISKYDRSYR
ncbi:MAG: glycosyltransferase family 2 protein [Candidatus Komeilibacteria bacterium]|nr:glycosyltransferase family 2 protein [Candidatus Komeilibacteria bacterium]